MLEGSLEKFLEMFSYSYRLQTLVEAGWRMCLQLDGILTCCFILPKRGQILR